MRVIIALAILAGVAAAPLYVAHASENEIVVEGRMPKPKKPCGGKRWTNCRLDAPRSIAAQAADFGKQISTARPMRIGMTRWRGGNLPAAPRFGNVSNIEEAYAAE